jgi:hypothetical protein
MQVDACVNHAVSVSGNALAITNASDEPRYVTVTTTPVSAATRTQCPHCTRRACVVPISVLLLVVAMAMLCHGVFVLFYVRSM